MLLPSTCQRLAIVLVLLVLSFETFAQPVNDDLANAIDVNYLVGTCSADNEFTNFNGTPDGNVGPCQPGGLQGNVWFKLNGPSTGQLHISVMVGTLDNPKLTLWTESGAFVACMDGPDNVFLSVDQVHPDTTYFISVDANSASDLGTFSLCLDPFTSYDHRSSSWDVTDFIGSCSSNALFTNQFGTPDGVQPSCDANVPVRNMWLSFAAPYTSKIQVDIKTGSGYGDMQFARATLWDMDGSTAIDCNALATTFGTLTLTGENLMPDSLYFVSVDIHNYGDQGTFSACLNDGVNIPCETNSTISASSTIDATDAEIVEYTLYHLQGNKQAGVTTFPNTGSATIATSGLYLLKSEPDEFSHINAVPTFYPDQIQWEKADTITIECASSYSFPIQIQQITPSVGTGSISGIITRSGELKTATDPIPGLDVVLVKTPPSAIVAQTTTDEEGLYFFDNLSDGTYEINVNVPGLDQLSTLSVDLHPGESLATGTNFTADSASGVVYPEDFIVTNVTSAMANNIDLMYTIVNDQLLIHGTLEGSVSIFNTHGQVVASRKLNSTNRSMELYSLPTGLYFIQFTGKLDTSVATSKFMLHR